MSVFDTALDTLYADPNLQVGASYYSTTITNPPITITLLRRKQDQDVLALSQTMRVRTDVFEVRKTELANPDRGGKLIITSTSEQYVIQSIEQTDDGRSWILDVRPA